MKSLFRTAVALTLSAGLCSGALAGQPASDAGVSQKLDQLNATAQVIDGRLQQILIRLNQSTQTGTCWQDGKAFSQGAKIKLGGVNATCGVQPKTGWPQWDYTDNLDSVLVRP
ncbi:hypothetical protein SAMN03159428_04922 [Kosakonia radicincitans]|uniref:Uncharacterized protein n=2 Tax=Kosakonia radicincitans TaxID=283686 RepID=A0AAX2EZB7_9ENTR|nr:hypothetical protein SAMN03159468_04949 [Kosakonia radicincitans]SFR26258.1 hypothetical protein SAMN03159514_04909 [Kosakonia radicincitans]SFU16756.1 hypothetical protein SAMN03159428_04922 [Kosakonia radicincitans]SFY32105.1 hypothetical protein SAMN03159436_04899 [Kosakonia radicincitans]